MVTKHLATIVQKYKEKHMLPDRKDPHGAFRAIEKTHFLPTDLNLINESFLVSSFELHVGPLALDIILT